MFSINDENNAEKETFCDEADNNTEGKDPLPERPYTGIIAIKAREFIYGVINIKSEILIILIASFLSVSLFNMLRIKTPASGLVFIKNIDLPATIKSFIIIFIMFIILRVFLYDRKFTLIYLMVSSYTFGLWMIYKFPRDLYLTTGCLLIIGYITYICLREENDSFIFPAVKKHVDLLVLFILFAGVAVFLSLSTIYRHRSFGSSNYDFGIFAQVFEYLRTTGLPLSTSERDKLLSHFAVHFSPIFYLILPGYMLFDTPDFLLIIQAFAICSGAFPIFLICRHYQLNSSVSLLVAATYLLYPGTVSPAMFDFHENKFLTVLILWMIYFFEKKKAVPMYVFMVLTLMVKEDASIYVFFIGLFILLVRKSFIHGSIMAVSSLLYFFIAVTLVAKSGEGVTDLHFIDYLLEGESGFIMVAKNIILNPAYFTRNIFTKAKLEFILYMMLPLLFLPIISKDAKRLILLVPMVLINLMSLYPYQANIAYQYTYGVAAILFYLFIMNLKGLNNRNIAMISIISVFASLTLTITSVEYSMSNYRKNYHENRETYMQTEKVLQSIPTTASVTATTYLVPHLTKVKLLYMYPSNNVTDYFVIDKRDTASSSEIKEMLIQSNYILVDSAGLAEVYKKQ